MATTKILKQTVESAEPKAQRYVIFDSVVPGFGLRVYPTGAKSWIFAYRPHPGGAATPKKTALIGTTDDFTPDAARRLADQMRAQVKTGIDPQGAKVAQREAPTVEAVAVDFIKRHVKPKRSAATVASYQDIFDRFVIPRLGKKKARDVSGKDMSALHAEIGLEKVLRDGTVVEGRPYQANKVLAVVSAMYGWASGPVALVPSRFNPVQGIERFTEEQRGRVLNGDELERLSAAIRLAETVGVPWQLDPESKTKHRRKDAAAALTTISAHAAAAIRLLVFTGMRLREVLHLRWDQIDLDQGLITLRKHKTARTTGVKSVVLNSPAMAVLSGLPRVGAFVIASDSAGTPDEKPRADLKRPWAIVRKAAGLEDLRIHDLRHNFGGFGAGGGMGLPIIGKLLGHSQPATTQRYAHLDNDPVRRASNAIGKRIADAMGDGGLKKTDNVVPMTKTAR